LKNFKTTLIAIFMVVIIAAAAFTAGAGGFFNAQKADAASVLYSEDTVTSIYNNASPAVVEIDITQQTRGYFGSSLVEGQGSGFVIDSTGNILTNNHVVDSAASVNVKLSTGSTVKAIVIGTDSVHDLALVKVDASAVANITPLTLGNSGSVKIGQMAIAIGNPYGLDNTVTVGVISGTNRVVSDSTINLTGMLQTDAALNPGNSGGPLLDASGAVIGINTAIETGTMGSSAHGIGFAVPSDVASSVLPNLKAGKTVTRPWIGVGIQTLNATVAQSLSLSQTTGVVVSSVVAGGPAEAGGIQTNDVVTAIDGKNITVVQDLQTYVNTKSVGDVITLSIVRGTATQSIAVTLGERPATTVSTQPAQTPPVPNQAPSLPKMPGRGNWRGN
jgi:S1-C subfamily serine protease